MTDYNSHILQQYADELYRRAKWIVFWTAVKYGLAAFVLALILAAVVNSQKQIGVSSENFILADCADPYIAGSCCRNRRRPQESFQPKVSSAGVTV